MGNEGNKTVKYSLITLNVFLIFFGIGLLIATPFVKYKIDDLKIAFDDDFEACYLTSLIVGSVLFLLGTFGFLSIYKENCCLMTIYCILLFIICGGMITLCSIAIYLDNTIYNDMERNLHNSMLAYSRNNETRESFDKYQKEFQCCEFGSKKWFDTENGTVFIPTSCDCPKEDVNDGNICINYKGKSIFKISCLTYLKDKVDYIRIGLIAFGYFVALLQV
ncbi:DgyrCDS4738 [Dimorphilus gyrociliatus]|uniref:DgyrCDS4738 n=1 Tax=Dimorphilus gyrociliatus TaxID=2664684 RepID=A0A7I8VJA8_9ANNE|nr:DgyrCDS4738 [Dimorphilus gyrociliatus]